MSAAPNSPGRSAGCLGTEGRCGRLRVGSGLSRVLSLAMSWRFSDPSRWSSREIRVICPAPIVGITLCVGPPYAVVAPASGPPGVFVFSLLGPVQPEAFGPQAPVERLDDAILTGPGVTKSSVTQFPGGAGILRQMAAGAIAHSHRTRCRWSRLLRAGHRRPRRMATREAV